MKEIYINKKEIILADNNQSINLANFLDKPSVLKQFIRKVKSIKIILMPDFDSALTERLEQSFRNIFKRNIIITSFILDLAERFKLKELAPVFIIELNRDIFIYKSNNLVKTARLSKNNHSKFLKAQLEDVFLNSEGVLIKSEVITTDDVTDLPKMIGVPVVLV